MLPADRPNTFKIKSPPRDFLYATTPAPIALAKFLAVKDRVSGATVNDVMMAVITLGLKRWCAATHDPLLATGNDLRGSFLVNMRSAERDGAPPPSVDSFFGNDFVLVSTVYPIHERTRFDAVLASRNATRTLKSTCEFAMRKVVRDYVVPLAPKGLLTHIALALNTKYSITTSNVFLSHEQLSLCGRDVTQIDFATFPPFGLYIGIATSSARSRSTSSRPRASTWTRIRSCLFSRKSWTRLSQRPRRCRTMTSRPPTSASPGARTSARRSRPSSSAPWRRSS